MTNDSDWYQQMAAAMKKRDHAIKMLDRWTKARQEAEAAIQELFAQNQNADENTD